MGAGGCHRRRVRRLPAGLALLLAAWLAAGCSLRATLRPETYVVERGDTLYSIAWDHGVDWRALARWNGLGPPYTIYPGQRLTLDRYPPIPASPPTPGDATGPGGGRDRSRSAPETAADRPASPRRQRHREERVAAADRRWRWPADGAVVRRYSGARHGIDIGGEVGDPIRATGSGRVVYSGSGLKGYGKLIIIKHDERYLSAYGYNSRLLVGQGARVAAGDKIAEMGLGPEQEAAVHFEIRRNGKPLDPARILPTR